MNNTISLSMNNQDSNKPLHLVVWQDHTMAARFVQPEDNSSATINALKERIDSLEKLVNQLLQRSTYFPPNVCPTPAGLDIRPRGASVVDSVALLDSLINSHPIAQEAPAPAPAPAPQSVKDVDDRVEAEVEPDDADADADADAEDEADADADEADADADADADEEAMELEEFDWKGVTYYRDSENQVYQKDSDGDLDDTPIGVWNEEKKKLLKYK